MRDVAQGHNGGTLTDLEAMAIVATHRLAISHRRFAERSIPADATFPVVLRATPWAKQ